MEELGAWKTPKVNLTWSEGNKWRLKKPLQITSSKFCFKYVVIEGDKIVRWEEGDNRTVDLEETLAQCKDQNSQPEYFTLENLWDQVVSSQKDIIVNFEPINETALKK